jgi:hypothetical protein
MSLVRVFNLNDNRRLRLPNAAVYKHGARIQNPLFSGLIPSNLAINQLTDLFCRVCCCWRYPLICGSSVSAPPIPDTEHDISPLLC